MAAPQRDFRSIAIEQHLVKMFETVASGAPYDHHDFDMRLEKYTRDAEKMQDVFLQGRLNSLQGTMVLMRCQLDMAERFYHRAYDCYVASNTPERAIGMENNLALLLLQRGRYAESLAAFEALHPRADVDNTSVQSNITLNVGAAYLVMFRFAEAMAVLEDMLHIYSDALEKMRNYANNGVFVTEQRVYLGMAQLGAGEVKKAIDSARLAAEFVEHVNTHYARLMARALLLRLAADGHIADDQAMLLAQIDSVLPVPGDLYCYVQMREEARYHLYRDHGDLARWFAERTLAMAERLESAELIANARALFAPT